MSGAPAPSPSGGGADDANLAKLTESLSELERLFKGWNETDRAAALRYGEAIERLNGAALRRLIGALKGDAAASAALRAAAGDELVYAVLRRHNIVKPSLNERIEAALASVRPTLDGHGGDVELVRLEPPVAEVRFIGACDGCSASMLTFHAGVKRAIQDACPEITEVKQAKSRAEGTGAGRVSPFAVAETGWLDAGPASDTPADGMLAVTIGGQALLLAWNGAQPVCYSDACAHLGFPLGDGAVAEGVLTCPAHGFQYALASGACLTAPGMALQAHSARLAGDRIEVNLAG